MIIQKVVSDQSPIVLNVYFLFFRAIDQPFITDEDFDRIMKEWE